MIETPVGPIPTLADLSIMTGRVRFNPSQDRNGRSRKQCVEEVFQAWLGEIGSLCLGCGSLMHSYESPAIRRTALEQITIDHIVARALGGSHSTKNQWCICRGCNFAKAKVEVRQVVERRRVRQ